MALYKKWGLQKYEELLQIQVGIVWKSWYLEEKKQEKDEWVRYERAWKRKENGEDEEVVWEEERERRSSKVNAKRQKGEETVGWNVEKG